MLLESLRAPRLARLASAGSSIFVHVTIVAQVITTLVITSALTIESAISRLIFGRAVVVLTARLRLLSSSRQFRIAMMGVQVRSPTNYCPRIIARELGAVAEAQVL